MPGGPGGPVAGVGAANSVALPAGISSLPQPFLHAAYVQDHVREKPENASLKSLTLKEFTGLIFQKVRCQPRPAPPRLRHAQGS